MYVDHQEYHNYNVLHSHECDNHLLYRMMKDTVRNNNFRKQNAILCTVINVLNSDFTADYMYIIYTILRVT